MTTQKQSIGKLGESLAVAYLQKNGYRIMATNWRCVHGEIDIVAYDGVETVFIEVKTRRSATTESAFESITASKMEKFIQTAYTYADTHHIVAWRIDAIAVALSGATQLIEHVQNAFTE